MKDINEFARVLAVEMTARTSELWRVVKRDDMPPQIESPRACLYICWAEWQHRRIQISPSVPHGMKELNCKDKITIDPSRKPEAIAADIQARILPQAVEHLTKCRAFDAEKRREEAEEATRRRMLAKYLPNSWNYPRYAQSDGRITAEIRYDNTIDLKINLSLTETIKLLKYLKG